MLSRSDIEHFAISVKQIADYHPINLDGRPDNSFPALPKREQTSGEGQWRRRWLSWISRRK
jgi:hypothetical protein